MKRIHALLAAACGLVFAASTCFAQMYTVTDLGTLDNGYSVATSINASGQVVGYSDTRDFATQAFRTAPNLPINPATDDLCAHCNRPTLWTGLANSINASGQAAGFVHDVFASDTFAFRTGPNSPINWATDNVAHTLNGTVARDINDSGQVLMVNGGLAYRTAPNSTLNESNDFLGGFSIDARALNNAGQVTGSSSDGHAFLTRPNNPVNPATDDLNGAGVIFSSATDVNSFGQVVGSAFSNDGAFHGFRTAPNRRIDLTTDDLGSLSNPSAINDYGEVVGSKLLSDNITSHASVYSNGPAQDLNDLISPGSGCELASAVGINSSGQIAANGNCGGQQRAILLNPIYKASVQQPIHADGSSVFKSKRAVIPVKFRLTQFDQPMCTLPQAIIAVTRATRDTLISVDQNVFSARGDDGTNFRNSSNSCQYHYNLAASELGPGTYRVDISIHGIMVGHAVFAIQ